MTRAVGRPAAEAVAAGPPASAPPPAPAPTSAAARTGTAVVTPVATSGPPSGPGRDRAVTVGIATAMVAKGIGLAAPLVITPACFRYLGDQRYGLWMAITALTGMAWFADLGLGNGLLTRLGQLADDPRQQAREISGAFATLGVVAVLLLAALAVVTPVVPWVDLFAVRDPAVAAQTTTMVLICFGAFAVNIPLSVIQRIQYARGQMVQSNAWQSAGALAALAVVLVAIAADWGPLVVVGGAVLAVPVTNLLNTVTYFWSADPAGRPGPRLVHRATVVGLLRLGLQFFALTTMSSIALNVDNPLVANVLGLTVAAHYAVVGKLFGVLWIFVGLVGMTVWPVNGAALARGEVAWVRRNTRRMMVLYGVIVGAVGLLLVGYGHRLIELWVGQVDRSTIRLPVLVGLAGWSLLVAVTSPLILVQNSIGLLRPQFVGWASFLVLATGLKVWGLRQFGLAGLPAAACAAYLLTMVPAALVGYRRALTRCGPS
ncbi:lipopolysaccharide biosynthesis protein [Micromonospora antibiotica]|uniref:Oligosaccharide flippase family protein n=1 Tax=Micromonospora antibiotica TaxID=2807623 RepID=A0ABS3VCY2_9ACTN|nr:oligosaccharide flippase family protein [Micromonospora antibiotica]MBO4163439.1 oligosaccharide flippase family protein [Micromonospora antibiotica]